MRDKIVHDTYTGTSNSLTTVIPYLTLETTRKRVLIIDKTLKAVQTAIRLVSDRKNSQSF